PPPSAAAAAAAALELLAADPKQVERLGANADDFRGALIAEGLEPGGAGTQIVPLEVGDAGATMALCERLLEKGVFAQGIRPPTVPEGSSRLRFSVMATHSKGELREAARLAATAASELGLIGAAPPTTLAA
ncbi:MAG TPA: aminotransferase class I/II-fold pyridoxal phosphate-dependent enzyme, partial [Solirubrobacterales bacterium]|nr:aminotransferase class I/II-fold pyridoxal phosphate-dependent enzyme [Solirubrobacterales bacterium]